MDRDFLSDREGLLHTLELLNRSYRHAGPADLPAILPESGLGPRATLDTLAPIVLGDAACLARILTLVIRWYFAGITGVLSALLTF